MKKISNFLFFKLMGWTCEYTVPERKKCIICVAPHTSNWDFIIAKLFYWAIGRKSGFVMKKQWFFWPLGTIFRKMGGIPITQNKNMSMTEKITETARKSEEFVLAITPEGTRSRVEKWHRGFYYIAKNAGIPIQCYAIDYKHKHITGTLEIQPSDNMENDFRTIMKYYENIHAKYPEKFTVEKI